MTYREASLSRHDLLRELGVMPLRLRDNKPPAEPQAAPDAFGNRLALVPQPQEMGNPALASLYARIGEAAASLGVQCVRVADAEADPSVRVLAFGDVALPDSIGEAQILRADALALLHADRERKRALWDLLQRLPREPV